MIKFNYRPEIDGLRAISVIAVIFYHVDPEFIIFNSQPFKGGFIGVDIFFVISGYLITKIILKELFETGSFSFKYFYERRVRRIIPPILFVIIVSIIFSWFYLIPSNFVDYANSIIYTIGFSSNFYFYNSGLEYGALDGFFKPFLHTWSLAVEEQFYLIFPISLFIVFKFYKKKLLTFFIIIIILSLLIANWTSNNFPDASFYLLHTRMWELTSGSILAYLEIKKGYRSQSNIMKIYMPYIGLIAILHSFIFFYDEMFHPSIYTLSPVIGTCLIIWYADKKYFITKILSSRLFVSIGLISYSLYLWHYPIFVYERIIDISNGDIIKKIVFTFPLILILSIFSYFVVEKPARDKKVNFKKILIPIIFVSLVLLAFNFYSLEKEGFKSRAPELLKSDFVTFPWELLNNGNKKSCYQLEKGCIFNYHPLEMHVSKIKKIYAIGDSHMATVSWAIKDKIVSKDYQFNVINSECIFFPEFQLVDNKTKKISKNCNKDYFSEILEELKKNKNSIIIFIGRFPLYLNRSYFNNTEGGKESEQFLKTFEKIGKFETIQESFIETVRELSENNKIILVYPIPEVGWHIPNKINSQFTKNLIISKKIKIEKISTSYDVFKKRTKSSFIMLNSLQNKNIFRIYPHKLFCDSKIKNRCITHDDKNIFYSDDDHLSTVGSKLLGNKIIEKIEEFNFNQKF